MEFLESYQSRGERMVLSRSAKSQFEIASDKRISRHLSGFPAGIVVVLSFGENGTFHGECWSPESEA